MFGFATSKSNLSAIFVWNWHFSNPQRRKDPRAYRDVGTSQAGGYTVYIQASEQKLHGGVQEAGATWPGQPHHESGEGRRDRSQR